MSAPTPPLREGDRLSNAEFLHRWDAMPELRRAELIGGVVFLMGGGNVPQPDSYLRILPSHGGQSRDYGDYNAGSPEFALEVSASTVSRDLGVKLELYRSQGVREYLTIVLRPRQVIWRQLVRGRYREIVPDEDGILRSRVFPGLWLDPSAIRNPRKSPRTALERGLNSPEHAAFARKLAAKRRK